MLDKQRDEMRLPPIKEMAESYLALVNHYQELDGPSKRKAHRKARHVKKSYLSRLLTAPADQISWFDLSAAADKDPELCAKAWQRIYDCAMEDYLSGERAGRVLGDNFDFGPLDRTHFTVTRASLVAEWDPLPGSEMQLIDMMAQTLSLHERWITRHSSHQMLGFSKLDETGMRLPPRVCEAEALEQSAMMTERFQRMYIRLVKTLRELKKGSNPVVVQNAGQVNVGQQQVNVTGELRP